MTPTGQPRDRGVQNERTALAWARSTLALLGAGLVVARISYDPYPVLGSSLAAASLLVAGWVLHASTQRYRHAAVRLARAAPLPDGRLPAALSLLVVLIGLVGLALVLTPR
jgi:uncharacterized membrane protein YidH (DUF202 family)